MSCALVLRVELGWGNLRRLPESLPSASSQVQALVLEGRARDGGQDRGPLRVCSSLGRSPGSLGPGASCPLCVEEEELRL